MMQKNELRLTVVQYAGDFRAASESLAIGGSEGYRAQRYTVEFIESLAKQMGSVTTITGFTNDVYDVTLASGARAIGAGFSTKFESLQMLRLLRRNKPDLVILRSPLVTILCWSVIFRRRTLLLLADSFNKGSIKSRVKLRLLSMLLSSSVFDVVANHGNVAARQLLAAGVPSSKIIAWDYPALDSPETRPTKQAASPAVQILYVGMLQTAKGVYDLIDAAELLRQRRVQVRIQLIGRGDLDAIQKVLQRRQLHDIVEVIESVPNSEIISRMAAADIIVIPSRHEYSEGVPLTIYEAYCSRTPIVASDHPMFAESIFPEKSALVFPAGRAEEMVNQITRLLQDSDLYARLSAGGLPAWNAMQVTVKWADLIQRWIDNTSDDRAWILTHSLDASSVG